MAEDSPSAVYLQALFERWQAGDLNARNQLFERVCEPMRRLTRKMLQSFPHLRRWEGTDDVFQNALVCLLIALKEVKPGSLQHFLRLANLKIRQELINLTRHDYGPEGQGANHASDLPPVGSDSAHHAAHEKADSDYEPERVDMEREIHERVQSLPQDEQEVIGLLWYQGFTQEEAAQILNVSKMTVRRRWMSARLRLGVSLKDLGPDQ